MLQDIKEIVQKELTAYRKSVDELKNDLIHQGFLEKDVDDAIYHATKSASTEKHKQARKYSRIFLFKEFFDRIGFGATSIQFLNILLYQIGGGYLLIAALNGLKAIISTLFSAVFHEYSKVRVLSKGFVSSAGVIFGFSFLILAAALAIKSVPLFVVAFLIGMVGIVAHGEPYTALLQRSVKKEHMTPGLAKIGMTGIFIIAVAFIATAALLDYYPSAGKEIAVEFLGTVYHLEIYGFLVAFEITAILFIISGYLLSFINEDEERKKIPFGSFAAEYYAKARMYLKIFGRNSLTRLMLWASVLTGAVQVIGNTYYGIFIYRYFHAVGYGPFMNVAIVFVVALLTSLVGASIAMPLSKKIGETPMLVFGTLLIAMLPLAFVYNPNLYAIGLASALSVIGSAMLGMAQGLFIKRILNQENAKMYFSSLSIASAIPLLVLIPLGGYVAETYGLALLFKILVGVLIVAVMPLYFILVVKTNKWSQKSLITQMSKGSGLTYN